jgi:allantoate deiminase
MTRCDALADCSDEPGRVTRLFCSPAMHAAHGLLRQWADAAGIAVRIDAAGNLFGRWEGAHCDGSRRLLIGSHLDSVVDAGKYDGVLGVVMGLTLVSELKRRDVRLPWAVEFVAFSEEEGVRFQTPFLGSRALAGTFASDLFELVDSAGISLPQSLRDFGLDPEAIPAAAAKPGEIVAYLEPHIEQGPQLETAGQPLGVVGAIAGQTRLSVQWHGPGGHAGTVPMTSRCDALTAASRWILAVEELGRAAPGLVATVGRVAVEPNAGNCIPRSVECSLDVRHADDRVRLQAVAELERLARRLGEDSPLTVRVEYHHQHDAVAMNAGWTTLLADACESVVGAGVPRMTSGAGHDAGVLAAVAPAAMLFVPCRGGVSHSPEESVEPAAVAVALEALLQLVTRPDLAEQFAA